VHPSLVEPYFDAVVAHLDDPTDDEWSEETFNQQGRISSLVLASNGTLWAGIGQDGRGDRPERGGLRARIGGVWTDATTANSGLASNDISTLTLASNGDLWIGTANAGLSLLQNAKAGPTATPTQTRAATATSTVTPSPTATQSSGNTPTPTNSPPAVNTQLPTDTPARGSNATLTPIPVTPTPGTLSVPMEVPEATTLILVGTGLAGLGSYAAYRWRRRTGGKQN
jgi:hypothetical protein